MYKWHGFKVKPVGNKVLKDYAGMNHYAAKQLGFKPVPPKNVILIDKTYKGSKKEALLKHEAEEAHLMSHGKTYFAAHKMALKAEHKPLTRWEKRR